MSQLVHSVKRLVLFVLVLIVAASVIAFTFDQFITPQIQPGALLRQTVRIVILVSFGSVIILLVRRSKRPLSRHVGIPAAAVFQSLVIVSILVVMIFLTLNIFEVSATTLLVGGGIVSIVMGLVISTFVGNLLAGTLVLMTHPFRVGDTVLVNNTPGKIEEITTMMTRIRNDIGAQMVIPNTAIVQGGVIITKFPREPAPQGRLPYVLGDRIYTTYLNSEGVVTELTSFYTKIQLESGRELTFLNASVLMGAVAIARITQKPK